jgi:mRNA interferase MazF
LWWVALEDARGSEQRGTRPCVVVQRDAANRTSPTTIIVPLADAEGRRVSPIGIFLSQGTGGLSKASVALCNQVRVVARARLREPIGSLDGESLRAVDSGLREILDI